MAIEFGKHWLQPIQERLSKKFPHLSEEELDNYDQICRVAREIGSKDVYDKLSSICDSGGTIKENDLEDGFNQYMISQYPWISSENLRALFKQSCYYAWRDGLMNVVE